MPASPENALIPGAFIRPVAAARGVAAQAQRHRRIGFPGLMALCALAVWLGLRLALLAHVDAGELDAKALLLAFAKGAWFDIATLCFLVSPLLLLSAALPNRFRARRTVHALRWAALWIALAALLFGALAEITFWREFSTRFNFIAIDYLIYTTEVIGNIRESYPVGALLAGIAVLATLTLWLARRHLRFDDAPHSGRRRAALLSFALLLPLSSAKLADVGQMEGSGNAYADELSGNGLFSLAAAMRRNELDYERFYRTLPAERAEALLAGLGTGFAPRPAHAADRAPAPLTTLPAPFLRRPKNIVLISVESLSAEFLGVHGNTRGLTPNLDRLAAEGVMFDRVFATGTRTVRGLEALSIGTPPIPGQAVVRRPGNEHLATLGEQLAHQGFTSLFLYGGYGYFDNMNDYFGANDYKVVDRTDLPAGEIVFENVWGVADESLFGGALREFDGAARDHKPFFAHIMTTSNHRPFTYPDGRIDIPSPGGRDGAVKYTDYAIGRFVEAARAKPWFDDTLFVITADHCASVAGKSRLPVAKYHIPLILYGPALLRHDVNPRMASQIDIPPTLLHALGLKGRGDFLGASLFDPAASARPERAFISNYQALGYYKNDVLTVLMPRRKVESYRIARDTLEATPAEPDAQLVEEAVAYYQSAARALKQGRLHSAYHEGEK
jgi:phosphoglycerol transferase MdoB-like AlkP superfamily enzyme